MDPIPVAINVMRLPPIADVPDHLNRVVEAATRWKPESRPTFAQLHRCLSWGHVVLTVALGLQSLELPALVTLAIVDQLDACDVVPMHSKWDVIAAVKHFHARRT